MQKRYTTALRQRDATGTAVDQIVAVLFVSDITF